MPLVNRTGRPRRSLAPKRHPRPAKTDTVRVSFARKNTARFSFTADVMEKLLDLHLGVFGAFYVQYTPKGQRHRMFRLQFARLADLRIPAVFVRIEPPTYDPHGKRIRHNPQHPNVYLCEIVLTKLKLRPGPFKPYHPELLWADSGRVGDLNGLILNFPDEAFDFTEPAVPLPRKSSGISAFDLAVW